MPSPPISTIWLEDLKEIKATIMESNKVVVMMADFYTSILRGPCFIRHYKSTRIYGLHMHTHTHTHISLITLKAKSGGQDRVLIVWSSDHIH